MIDLAWKNLRRNRRRNFATGTAIAFGFAGLLLLGSYYNRAFNFLRVFVQYPGYSGHISILKKDALEKSASDPKSYGIDLALQKEIDSAVGNFGASIAFKTWALRGEGLVGNGCRSLPFLAVGVDPMLDDFVQQNLEVKEWAPEATRFDRGKSFKNFSSSVTPIALSRGLARLLGKKKIFSAEENSSDDFSLPNCELRDFEKDANVQLLSTTWAGFTNVVDGEFVYEFTTGFAETENSAVRLPLASLQKLYDTDQVSQLLIWIKPEKNLKEIVRELKEKLNGLPLEVYVWNEAIYNPYLVGTVSFLGTMLFFIALVLLVIVGFSIINTVSITLLERRQEMGMMRSFGYTGKLIQWIYVIETQLLSLISLAFGGVLAGTVIFLVNRAGIEFSPPGIAGGIKLKLIPNVLLVTTAAAVVFVTTSVAAFFAARHGSRVKITELLSGHKQ